MGKTGAAGSASDSATEYGRVVDALTTVRSINKTDAVSLIRTFDTIENIVRSDADQLIICPGMAALKYQSYRLRQRCPHFVFGSVLFLRRSTVAERPTRSQK
ncbi:unnamed protein product, partial [Medioppia subpectinata]